MSDRVTAMTTIAEASNIVRALAEPWAPGDSVKAGLNRAARRARMSHRRITTLWYGRPCALLAHEMDTLREAYRATLDRRAADLEAELRRIQAEMGRL